MILAFLKANPGLVVSGGLLATGMLVALLFAFFMRRAGQSLRPVLFLLGFFLIVVLPQFVYHLNDARRPKAVAESPLAHADAGSGWEGAWAHDQGRFLYPEVLFGPRVERPLIQDARPVFPDILGSALAAQIAYFPSGNTLLAARFSDQGAATAALRAYLAQFQAGMTGGDLVRGVVTGRGTLGDRARIRLQGPLLMIWTAADLEGLAAFTDGWMSEGEAPLATGGPAASNVFVDPRLGQPGMWLFLLANLAVAVAFFFRGATWACRVPAPENSAPLSRAELAGRLLAVNGLDVPMRIIADPDGRTLLVDWRLADARWLDLARAHRLRRQHRLVLDLDEASHTARVREYWRDLEASVGADGVRGAWHMGRGITFFQHEHQRVFGLQFDAHGCPSADLSHAYTFNLQELRRPFRQAVTQAGWHWQPVLLGAPPGLRWLTE